MQEGEHKPDAATDEERPLVFGSWNTLYGAVIGFLVVLIVLFSLFTKVFE